MATLNREERALAASVEREEWRSVSGLKSARARYQTYAEATFKKDRRVNIRISGVGFRASVRAPQHSCPQGFDEPGVRERPVPGDECTSNASRGADDQAIERVPDGRQRGELVQLRQIEGKEPEARACFHGSSQLGKANAHPPQSSENQHLCDHRRRCQRLIAAGFDIFQGLPRQATELVRRRQHEDAGVSVEDVSTRHGVPVASRVSSRVTAER